MRRTLQIRTKIVLPVTILFVLAIAGTALISVSMVARNLEQRLGDQIEYASGLISRTDFALNPSILEQLKPMIGAEVVTFASDGTILAGTLSEEGQAAWPELLRRPVVVERLAEGHAADLVLKDVDFLARNYRVAFKPVQGSPDKMVAILADTSDLKRAKRAIARPVAILAFVMIVLMSLISHLVARSITAPIEELVAHTGKLAAGDWNSPVTVRSADEIGELAGAFNAMAEQLRESKETILHSEKLAVTGQLAARVAHDIRNPLSSIKMQAQLLRNKVDPTLGSSIKSMLTEIDRVEWVVQGLLDLARPAELQMSTGNVNDVVEDMLQTTGPQLTHSRIAVTRELDGEIPSVLLDAERLRQALRNVIVNAVEAMPQGGTLLARTHTDPAGHDVVIEIIDSGEGLDPQLRDRVFDPFFTTKREGVGLGLVNTMSVVERHGGTIGFVPGEDGGTRVVITLPAADRQRHQEAAHGEHTRRR